MNLGDKSNYDLKQIEINILDNRQILASNKSFYMHCLAIVLLSAPYIKRAPELERTEISIRL